MSTKRTSEPTVPTRRRVLVTRSADQASALAAALREIGVDPILAPTIEIVPPPSYAELDRAIAELDQVDYLVLTSANAVDAFFNRLAMQTGGTTHLAGLQSVAVGPKSAEAMIGHGVVADLVPQDYRAEGVVALLAGQVAGKKVLYPKAALARDLIPSELRAAGAEVIDPVAYASAPPVDAAEQLSNAFRGGLDLLTFTASSTVRNFVDLLDAGTLARARQVPVASIGPLTSETARNLGFEVVVEPGKATLEGMVEAIKGYFAAL